MRDRVLKDQGADLTEEELLELLLASALHRHDVQNLVADLRGRFHSLSGILSATPEELCRVKGIGEVVAVLIKLISQLQSQHTRSAQRLESRVTNHQAKFSSLPLFAELPDAEAVAKEASQAAREPTATAAALIPARPARTKARSGPIRAIQDLIWKEALLSLPWSEKFEDTGEFQNYVRQHLPQNSLSTRERYAQTVVKWFYPDGMQGLTAQVWRRYQDPGLAEEIFRYLYLSAEKMAGAIVADALFPIAENASIPDGYIAQFIRDRFGTDVPGKTTERLKANLRKVGFLSYGKERRDSLRAITPSATGFLILLHYRFSQGYPGGAEFQVVASDPFWKYLGLKSEDRLRAILREALDHGLIAKYLVADRIESVSLRYSFREFVEGRMRL